MKRLRIVKDRIRKYRIVKDRIEKDKKNKDRMIYLIPTLLIRTLYRGNPRNQFLGHFPVPVFRTFSCTSF
jgi:hypothetical protein